MSAFLLGRTDSFLKQRRKAGYEKYGLNGFCAGIKTGPGPLRAMSAAPNRAICALSGGNTGDADMGNEACQCSIFRLTVWST